MSPCAAPITFENLVAWWTGELDGDTAARVEDHFFGCDACAGVAARFTRLAAALGNHLPPIVSHAHRDRLLAAGTRIRLTPVESGVDTSAVFGRDVDVLVHALRGDLAHADRVDVEILIPELPEPVLCQAVPFDAAAGEVLVCCQRHFMAAYPTDPTFRVHAIEGGQSRLVGTYLVRHLMG